MEKTFFGNTATGVPVYSYKLENDKIFAQIMTYGATLKSFGLNFGEKTNLIGSFDRVSDYETDTSYQGAIIGRVANRIENACFKIDGKEYHLPKNDGENCLHGGVGFNTQIWDVKEVGEDFIELSYYSKDGEAGFPGGLNVSVKYVLLDDALIIDYTAIPEKKTPIALTNHVYFNLDGIGADIYSHEVTVFADRYTAVNSSLIPTGEHPAVDGTPFDLRSGRRLGDILTTDFEGYDHNFCLTPTDYSTFLGKSLGLAATATNGNVQLLAYTNMPGIQFYSGNFLGDGPSFAGEKKQVKHGAFCLEAQTEPNSVNRGIGIYDAGEVYRQTTAYRLKKI